MKTIPSNLSGIVWMVGSLLAVGPLLSAQTTNPPPIPSAELPAGSEVLARGPVHEAFAKPVSIAPEAPIVVPNQPPDNLQEVPPAEKPAGADIVWVPGYWGWDADRNDFIWVSGCWRNAPPNTYWVPGYWLRIDTGWEWISGFWKPIESQSSQEIEYLPEPPAPFDVEAPGASPLPDQVWVPGCWFWSGGQYIQRHGYWITETIGWAWVPAHYVWTPRGYIFCAGHWDHDFDDCGVLFTPVYFPPEVRVYGGFVYCPSVCVDLGIVRLNLFCYPKYRHYCFGDYYDDAYRHVGIYPWYQCQTVHTWYDPTFVYDRWHYGRTDPHWADRQARQFALLRSKPDLRPARTFSGLQARRESMPAAHRPERPLVQPLRTYAASQSTSMKFERISDEERRQIASRTTDFGKLREQRNHWEASPSSSSSAVRQNVTPAARDDAADRREADRLTRKESREDRQAGREAMRVRVTSPERESIQVPFREQRQFNSRYIEKEAPNRPDEERGADSGYDRDSRGGRKGDDSRRGDW